MLTALQKDVLTEILNIQLGKSANLLSEMVNQKIILSVPEVELTKGSEISSVSMRNNPLFDTNDFVVTSVAFGSEFAGKAFVIFPQENAEVLVKACLGEDLTEISGELSNIDADVIKEICNIILNSVVGEFGNLLEQKLEYAAFELGYSIETLDDRKLIPADSYILLLFTSFLLIESQIRGAIIIALTASSFDMLINKINDMLRDIND